MLKVSKAAHVLVLDLVHDQSLQARRTTREVVANQPFRENATSRPVAGMYLK